MALTTVSNFAGKSAGFYISAALKEAKSLEYLTMIENIKYKSNIQKMNATSMIQDASCDVNLAGTLALTENVLEPKLLMIQTDLCKSTLLDSWEALEMKAGTGAMPPASFNDYVISYLGEIIANGVEDSVWSGSGAALSGTFLGFLDAAAGYISTGVGIVPSVATGAYTAGNIIGEIQTLMTDWMASATAVNIQGREDTYIYMSRKTFSLYVSAIALLTNTPWANMNEDWTPVFEGQKIVVLPGFPDNQLVAAQKSNLYFGTDLLSDKTRIDLLDMSQNDGSDNVRVICRYSAGVQTGINADIVWQA